MGDLRPFFTALERAAGATHGRRQHTPITREETGLRRPAILVRPMSRIRQIYRLLRSIDDTAVDRAMATALPSADPMAVQLITLSLLERQHPDGMIALVMHFHILPPELQQTVVRHVQDLYRPLREAAGMGSAQGRSNVVQIIRQGRATRLAYLVIAQLRRHDEQLRQQAADCLLELAAWADTSVAEPVRAEAGAGQFLHTAIEEALETFAAHEHPAVLLATARLMPRPMPRITAIFSDEHHVATRAMRRTIEHAAQPEIRRALLWLLQMPALTDAVIAALPQVTAEG